MEKRNCKKRHVRQETTKLIITFIKEMKEERIVSKKSFDIKPYTLNPNDKGVDRLRNLVGGDHEIITAVLR